MLTVIIDQKLDAMFCDVLNQRFSQEHVKQITGEVIVDPVNTRCIALVDMPEDRPATQDDILTITALNDWAPHMVDATIVTNGAKRKKLTHNYVHTVFDYALRFAGKSRINAMVAVTNVKSVALVEDLGFVREAVMRDALGENKDAYLYAMTKQHWLQGRFATAQT